MSDKRTTAVEWLFEQIPSHLRLTRNGFEMFQQAKQMEREQIDNAWSEGFNADFWDEKHTSKNYYDQTYGE